MNSLPPQPRTQPQRVHPEHYTIARGMLWGTLFVLVGKLAGAGKEMAMAYRYGVSEQVDGYIFVTNLLTWPVGFWFSALTVVLVPLVAGIQQNASPDLPRFRSELLGFTLLLGLGLLVSAWLAVSLLLHSPWTGLPAATAVSAGTMLPGLVLLTPLGMLISLLSALMLSAGRHTNTLLESVPALVLLIALLLVTGNRPQPLVWGTTTGFLLHLIALALLLARRGEIELPRFSRQSPQWPAFWKGFGIMLAGQALMSLAGIIDQFFAARLEPGAIATLGYANRIMALILGLGATAVSRATLPVFCKIQAVNQNQLHKFARHWAGLLFMAGLAAMLAAYWLAPWGVRLLFERGEFTADSSAMVTQVLRYGLGQIPFYFSALVLVSYASSQRRYTLLFWSGVTGLMVKILANMVLMPVFAINGIALSWVAVYLFNSLFFWFTLMHSK